VAKSKRGTPIRVELQRDDLALLKAAAKIMGIATVREFVLWAATDAARGVTHK